MLETTTRLKKWILLSLLTSGLSLQAQESALSGQYRELVRNYNQDLRRAEHASAISQETEKSAKADFLPSLSANANFNYTGNPRELSVEIPSIETPLYFQGRDVKYGASLTLTQPVYSGGALKAGYEKARKEHESARLEQRRLLNDILHDADVRYWNKVALDEMARVAREYQNSIATLVKVVGHRVREGYTDRNDLLMAEVKLNDADYRLIQARDNAEVARLALNAYSGIPSEQVIPTDSIIPPLSEPAYGNIVETAMSQRVELSIATNQVDIQTSNARIANARYLPKFSIGIDGSYASPGYDFTADLSPNYAIYAKLSIPVFEWGKRRNTRSAGKHGIRMATENYSKVEDNIRLEAETAYYSYTQALQKVRLTGSSLQKAKESERLAMEKYKEGHLSIVEVINAQLYHLDANINYIQSKRDACFAKSGLDRALGLYAQE